LWPATNPFDDGAVADTRTRPDRQWYRLAAGGIATGYLLATVLVIVEDRPAVVGYATATATAAVVALTAAAGLVAAVMLGAGQPTGPVGALLLLVCAWLAPIWVGWSGGPPPARSASMLALPFLVPCLLHVALAAPAGRLTGRARLLVGAGYVAAAAASAVRAASYDPFQDPHCWNNCTVNLFLVRAEPAAARAVDVLWLVASIGLGLLAAALVVARLARATRAGRRTYAIVLVPAAVAALTEAAYAVLLLHDPAEDPARPWFAAAYLVRGTALILLAAGVAAVAVLGRRRRAALSRLAQDLGVAPAPGALRAALARSLGDPDLNLAYWLSASGRFVDPDGRTVDPPSPGHATTEIRRAGDLIAVLRHDRAVDPAAHLSELVGSAARLAIDNERLRAALLAQVDELSSSRRRLVAAADAARRGLERDLHDGAQQHLLAVVYELRLARQSAGDDLAAALDGALETAGTALRELRDLAHGIFPAVLEEGGLEPALWTLVDQAAVPVELSEVPAERLPAPVERAAYLVVAGAVDAAAAASGPSDPGRLDVRLQIRADRLDVDVAGPPAGAYLHVADRVGALGGRLTSTPDRLHAEIPLPRDGDPTPPR
jgi:signal transduction histidine kinase